MTIIQSTMAILKFTSEINSIKDELKEAKSENNMNRTLKLWEDFDSIFNQIKSDSEEFPFFIKAIITPILDELSEIIEEANNLIENGNQGDEKSWIRLMRRLS